MPFVKHNEVKVSPADTDESEHEQVLQHAARMEAIASLTSGVAHDFRNLMTVLIGNLYLLGEELRHDESLFAKVKQARDAAQRGADLTQQLLDFARRDARRVRVVEPVALAASLAALLTRVVGSRIVIETRFDDDIAAVEVNSAQLESVIVNLVINARDAIEAEGRVIIEIANEVLDGSAARDYSVVPGPYVRLAVSDDGAGMPSEIAARAFEPFFTTKGNEHGTGLGLSMVRQFAREAGGAVAMHTAPGRGSSISVLLPVARTALEETGSVTMPLATLPGGDETVLLLIDDPDVLSTVGQSLALLGYTVEAATRDADPIAVAAATAADLVLVDDSFRPSRELMRAARRDGRMSAGLLMVGTGGAEAAGTLRAPFSLGELAAAVRGALDAGRGNE